MSALSLMSCWWSYFAKYFFSKQLSFTNRAKLCQTGPIYNQNTKGGVSLWMCSDGQIRWRMIRVWCSATQDTLTSLSRRFLAYRLCRFVQKKKGFGTSHTHTMYQNAIPREIWRLVKFLLKAKMFHFWIFHWYYLRFRLLVTELLL